MLSSHSELFADADEQKINNQQKLKETKRWGRQNYKNRVSGIKNNSVVKKDKENKKINRKNNKPSHIMRERFGGHQQLSECRYLDRFGKFPRKGRKWEKQLNNMTYVGVKNDDSVTCI